MDQGPEKEMQDIIEEVPEELGHSWNKDHNPRRHPTSSGLSPHARSLFFWGAVGLILIILIALFLGGTDKDLSGQVDSLKARLDKIERLAAPEETSQRITGLEDRIKALEQSMVKLENARGSLRGELDKLVQQLNRLQRGGGSAVTKARDTSQPEGRLHTVRRGESLYGIAQKYGVTLSTLLDLNNLTKKQRIHPGQKLLISPTGGQ
jgi:LysM repeat protein